MAYNCFKPAEHSGGGADPGGWKQPRRIVSMSSLTLRHNVPMAMGNHGSFELVDCHVIGPSDASGWPSLFHVKDQSGGPSLRLSEVTYQPSGLFDAADLDGDGRL